MNVQYLLLKINLMHVLEGVLSYKSWLMLLQNPVTISAFSAHPAQIHKATTSLTEKFQEIIIPRFWWTVVLCSGRQWWWRWADCPQQLSVELNGCVSRVQCSFPFGGRKVQMVTVPEHLQVNVYARYVPIWLQVLLKLGMLSWKVLYWRSASQFFSDCFQ